MKISYKKYTAIFILLLITVSCTKLDYKPSDIIDPDKAFRNLEDIKLGLNGAYAVLNTDIIINNSIVSDEVNLPTENTVSNTDTHRWLYSGSNGSVTSLYGDYYQAVNRVNRTLEGLELLTFTGKDLTTANNYKGQLLALRAFFHFELLRAYAAAYQNGALGVTYLKTSTFEYLARDKFEATVAGAKSDLIAAKTLLPESADNNIRISRVAVSAIQARLALYEKNWADAITYSTEVITALPLADAADFPLIWKDQSEAEVAWKAKRTFNDTRTGAVYFRQDVELILYAPSFKLINTFDQMNDVRYAAYINLDPTRTDTGFPYLVNKYAGTSASPGQADLKLFRTGEMYLIRAEAKAESGGDGAADLNALRAARITGYTAVSFADKAALIDAIYTERFKELAFEGHRFFDLRRRNLPVERLAIDAVNASGAVTLSPAAAQYAFPLPAQELAINKNAVQNPNY